MKHAIEMIPEKDRAILAGELKLQQEKLPNENSVEFIRNILWRIYTEICCDYNVWGRQYFPDAGDAYKKWVNDEVYFALKGHDVNDQMYAETYQRIVRGVASRAIELISEWEGKTYPKDEKKDKRNLRSRLVEFTPSSDQPFEPIPVAIPEPPPRPLDIDGLLEMNEEDLPSRIHSLSTHALNDMWRQAQQRMGGHEIASPFVAALSIYAAPWTGNRRVTEEILEADENRRQKLTKIIDVIEAEKISRRRM